MERVNPVFLCYCRDNGLDPVDQFSSTDFISWVSKQKKLFATEKNINRRDPGSSTIRLLPEDVAEFHEWLKRKHLKRQ